MLPAEQTAPALSPASAVALALRRARARLARRFPGRSAADRDDALQQAAEMAIRLGWLGKPKAAAYLAGHAARMLCGGYWYEGRWRPSRSAATSIASPARVGPDGAEVAPDEWLAGRVEAAPSTSPDADLRGRATLREVACPDRAARAAVGEGGREVLGELLRRGWSASDLAAEVGVDPSTIARWGRERPPLGVAGALRGLLERDSPAERFRLLLADARAAGWSLRAIGDACAVSPEGAARWGRGATPAPDRRPAVERALRAMLEGDARELAAACATCAALAAPRPAAA